MKASIAVVLAGIICGVLTASGSAEASFTDVRAWSWWVLQDSSTTGVVAPTGVTLPADPVSFAIQSKTIRWEITATYTAQGSATQARAEVFQLMVDGATVTGCAWRVDAGLADTAIRTTNFLLRCNHPGILAAGPHTVEILGTATNANPVVKSRTDIVVWEQAVVTDATLDAAQENVKAAGVARTQQTNSYLNGTDFHLAGVTRAESRQTNTFLNGTDAHLAGVDRSEHRETNGLINATDQHLTSLVRFEHAQTNSYVNASVGANFSAVIAALQLHETNLRLLIQHHDEHAVQLRNETNATMEATVAKHTMNATEVAWVLWAGYAYLTYRIRDDVLRIVMAAVGWCVLFLPLGDLQFGLLTAGQTGFTLITLGQYITGRR